MIKDHVKRDISDFLDGELPAEAQDKLFSASETARENLEYLQTLRLIKRAESELSEPSPEKLKSSVSNVVGKTVVLKRKSNAFTFMWAALAVILVLAVLWAVFFPVYTPSKVPEPQSSAAPSAVPSETSSESSDVPSSEEPSDVSSGESGSSDEESSAVEYDYSLYLPYGIDEYLPQEYRGEKYAYAIFAKGTYVATLMKADPSSYKLVYNQPGETAVLLCDNPFDDTVEALNKTWFKITDAVTDEKFDGISAGSRVGVIFVRGV